MVELMVTLAIFVVMTSTVLANYPSFNNKIGLEILAQNIALSIREAQVYGISIRAEGLQASARAPAYGVHFYGAVTDLRDQTHTSAASGGGRQYIIFADGNGNKQYDGTDRGGACQSGPGDVAECVNVFTLSGPSEIGIICSNLHTDNATLSEVERLKKNIDQCKLSPILTADVTFKRPNPEAYIYATAKVGGLTRIIDGATELNVFVRTTSGTASDRMVTIWNTGQISVQACNTKSGTADYGKCNAQ